MPSELLHAPPLYTLVGIYRLLTDPSIRGPVLDKVKHASVRGIVVALVYAVVSWRPLRWFIKRFLVGGEWTLFGFRKVKEVVDGHTDGKVAIRGFEFDIVFCEFPMVDKVLKPDTHLLILIPQISSILRFFIYKNLKLARSRAYALTVASRRKPPQFWNQASNPPSYVMALLTSRGTLRNGLTHLDLDRGKSRVVIVQVRNG